jgi:hypothetical protein
MSGRGAELVSVRGRLLVEHGKSLFPVDDVMSSVTKAADALHEWARANVR